MREGGLSRTVGRRQGSKTWFNGKAVARLFFSVGVSPEVVSALRSLVSKLRGGPSQTDGLRFVDVEQAHYTLRFLGEKGSDEQAAALRAGRAAAAEIRGFDLTMRTLGVFPDERRPHTLWLGAGEGAARLTELARRLEECLAHEGFPNEARPFVPHLTLARVKRHLPRHAMRALLAGRDEIVATLRVESFALMESKPVENTVRYIALETFPLEMPCMPSKSPSTAAPK
jgi:2'-5' RNA ligase